MKPNHKFEAKLLSTDDIYLDIHNPRFMGERGAPVLRNSLLDDPYAQEQVRWHLIERYGVKGLVESILRLGFLQLDSIVVREFAPQRYVVVEGNRRLAAIKTILWDTERKVLAPSEHVLKGLEQIDVLILTTPDSEADVATLLLQGVRHISGVKAWGPYQQGRLIHTLVDREGMKFSEAALAVGLSPSRVSVLLRGYYGLQQLFENDEFAPYADTGMFSYFEHAHVKPSVREWLGWDDELCQYTNNEHLRFFYQCIIPVSGESAPRLLSRHVRDYLSDIVEHKEAMAAFCEDGVTVQAAYAMTRDRGDVVQPLIENIAGVLNDLSKEGLSDALSYSDIMVIRKLHKMTGNFLQQVVN